MIHSLELTDFKAFARATVPLRRITLVTGPNSSGKTALLSAIAAVLQSGAPHAFPFDLVANGPNCSLGGFADILRRGKGPREFSLSLGFKKPDGVSATLLGAFAQSGTHEGMEATRVSYRSEDRAVLDLEASSEGMRARFANPELFNYIGDERVFGAFSQFITTLQRTVAATRDRGRRHESKSAGPADAAGPEALTPEALTEFLEQNARTTNQWRPMTGRTVREVVAELAKNPVAQSVISEIETVVRSLQSRSAYVGPVRAHPSRFYLSQDSQLRLDPLGENAFAHLLEWSRHTPKKMQEVISALQLLGLAQKIDVSALLGDIVRLKVSPHAVGRAFSIADVGFGVSQLLPVVVADVSLPQTGTLIVNQPEVHLHPSSQALFADYMIGQPETRQYVIETHSEYLLNRIRLRIAQGRLNASDVALVFVDPPTKKRSVPRIGELKFDAKGAVLRAPKAFFRTYYQDSFELATAGFRDHST